MDVWTRVELLFYVILALVVAQCYGSEKLGPLQGPCVKCRFELAVNEGAVLTVRLTPSQFSPVFCMMFARYWSLIVVECDICPKIVQTVPAGLCDNCAVQIEVTIKYLKAGKPEETHTKGCSTFLLSKSHCRDSGGRDLKALRPRAPF